MTIVAMAIVNNSAILAQPIKPESLTEIERQVIQGHSRIGARILEPIAAYREIIPMVLQHHESFDGSGYPNGIAGEDICLGGRILAVADAYDSLVSDRPYRDGMGHLDAVEVIKNESGKQFDPVVVKSFLKAFTDTFDQELEQKLVGISKINHMAANL